MEFLICQRVTIVDMNNEVIREELFEHGKLDAAMFSIGCSVTTHQLGLKQFEVVHDKRMEPTTHRITDIEYSLISHPPVTRAYLDPVTLIVGQHDVGEL